MARRINRHLERPAVSTRRQPKMARVAFDEINRVTSIVPCGVACAGSADRARYLDAELSHPLYIKTRRAFCFGLWDGGDPNLSQRGLNKTAEVKEERPGTAFGAWHWLLRGASDKLLSLQVRSPQDRPGVRSTAGIFEGSHWPSAAVPRKTRRADCRDGEVDGRLVRVTWDGPFTVRGKGRAGGRGRHRAEVHAEGVFRGRRCPAKPVPARARTWTPRREPCAADPLCGVCLLRPCKAFCTNRTCRLGPRPTSFRAPVFAMAKGTRPAAEVSPVHGRAR